MASLDKEIKVIMLKGASGTDGKSSYELAVEELHYSGTLEEWLESFSTPENYITRNEFKKVTQAEYDELEANHQLIPDCYYIITDDETYDDLIERIEAIESSIEDIQDDITTKYNARVYTRELMTQPMQDFETLEVAGVDISTNERLNDNNIIEITGLIKYNYVSDVFTIRIVGDNQDQFFGNATFVTSGEKDLITINAYIKSDNTAIRFAGQTYQNFIDNSNLHPSNAYSIKILSIKELVNY